MKSGIAAAATIDKSSNDTTRTAGGKRIDFQMNMTCCHAARRCRCLRNDCGDRHDRDSMQPAIPSPRRARNR
ncbi:hypothetical protein DB771_16840 [Burkholderia sp. AU29985]|nr:hypothetical protein XM57_20070 [Burkholderia cepacia]AYZ94687.1 hypothetical protein EGY28_06215 [Burkholderia dolosa]ETP63829.1 hypothetical protein BDSB_23825 [Burkholderia dolosa PC543]PUA75720.1 hypothetical protein DB771_16840 [Burkholderia sp. AU29985]